tara:strand:- start:1039 stop:1329 length:291 start_codon:yes stop_codon:yes gene_type:complete
MSYFKVGEECILQSKLCPELNGDCTVIDVLDDKPRRKHLPNGEIIIEGGCSYIITTKHLEGWSWAEEALRKKHKPSTKSLSSMIEELNIKSKVESK